MDRMVGQPTPGVSSTSSLKLLLLSQAVPSNREIITLTVHRLDINNRDFLSQFRTSLTFWETE